MKLTCIRIVRNGGSFYKAVIGLLLVTSLVSCSSGSGSSAGTEIEFSNGSFSTTLVEAQITSLFAEVYKSVEPAIIEKVSGKTTLFAPYNVAMEKYLLDNSLTLEGLIANPADALVFVLNHMYSQEISASSLLNSVNMPLVMLGGLTFSVDTNTDFTMLVSESGLKTSVIAIDLVSTDGVVHIVDSVLQP
jgi:uncharacterized surface protein with fasciclin (FAS1) repeats